MYNIATQESAYNYLVVAFRMKKATVQPDPKSETIGVRVQPEHKVLVNKIAKELIITKSEVFRRALVEMAKRMGL